MSLSLNVGTLLGLDMLAHLGTLRKQACVHTAWEQTSYRITRKEQTMPDKMFVVIKLNAAGYLKSIIGIFADKDDAEKFAQEKDGYVIENVPYNP